MNWHYGDKGNFEFLKLYGFILTDDSQPKSYSNYLDVTESGDDVQLAKVKRQIFKKKRMPFTLNENFDSEEVLELLIALRFKVFDDAENVKQLIYAKGSYYENNSIPVFSIDNEIKALKALEQLCTEALEAYPNNLADDITIRDSDLSRNARNALELVIEEKLLLTKMLAWV